MAIHVIEISIAISLTNALCRKLLGIVVVVVVVAATGKNTILKKIQINLKKILLM